MTSELRVRNQSASLYVRALSQAWRNGIELHDPSLWLLREPELEEKMLRDADIAHAVGYRRHLIAGRQWACVPRLKRSPRAPVAVAVATELLDSIESFTQARLNLSRAFFSGARFARIHGETRTLNIGDGTPRTWWVPTHLEDLDKRVFRLVPRLDLEDGKAAAEWQQWNVVWQEWVPMTVAEQMDTVRHVYQDDQASLGHGRALREALGWWWYAKENVFRESLQAVERFAQGIMVAKVDGARDAETGLPNEELIRAWRDVLEDLRSRHVLVHDKADEVASVQMSSAGWELLHTIRNELRSTIFTLVLGANLTTSANTGGSYALAEIQENSTEALVQYDRETLEETLTKSLLGCIWWHNHANLVELGIHNEKPRFSIVQEKRMDPQQRATVAQMLVNMGVNLSLADVLKQTGFQQPEDGEQIVRKAQAPAAPDLSGFAGFSRLSFADQERCPDGTWKPEDGQCPEKKSDDSTGGGALGGKAPWEMTRQEYNNVTPASKVVEKMLSQTEGRVDAEAIRNKILSEGKYYREQKVDIDQLKIQDVEDVDPSRASSSKGAIIVSADGFIVDGRHRAAAAKARGETTITALVPTNDVTPHKQVVKQAIEDGLDVPQEVRAQYGFN